MYCGKCGTQTQLGQSFCNVCGEPLGAAPTGRVESRLERHVKVLGILWLALSVLRLIPGLAILHFGGYAMRFVPFDFRGFVAPLAAIVGVALAASAVAGIVAGWGLLERRPWARVLALVLGIISLIHVPFGTALGIYTLWVLLPVDSEREYQRLSRAA
jgi:hypothetical protein